MPQTLLRLHLICGIVGIIAFVLTGQYMDRSLEHMFGVPDGERMLLRSAYIYIFLTSLLNIVIAAYASRDSCTGLRAVTSIIILLSPWVMLVEFFYGTNNVEQLRLFSNYGLYALFLVALILIAVKLTRR